MNEIYWVTRLDHIRGFLIAIAVVGVLALIFLGIGLSVDSSSDKLVKKLVAGIKTSIVSILVAALGIVFVPSTKEMLIIYAAGGSLDYISNSQTIKQLPDKCVQAIDALLEEYITPKNE